MNWIANPKSLKISTITAHPDARPAPVCGREPGTRIITFTPSELFGAMARCSHLQSIDPSIVTQESEIYRNLVSKHVTEERSEFAILDTANRLKDYNARHMAGVVGDGLSYLQMIRDGYEWVDHFENLPLTGSPGTERSPDFVFSRRDDPCVAISESKATRGSSRANFGRTVSKAYVEQVSPYLGLRLGSSVASHGFAIGSFMTSSVQAELFIHHTDTSGAVNDGDSGSDPSAVRRGNYINIFSLLLGSDASRSMRARSWSAQDRWFLTSNWLGRKWLIGLRITHGGYRWDDLDEFFWLTRGRVPWRAAGLSPFALDLEIATSVLGALEAPDQERALLDNIPRLPAELIDEAKRSGGAIFPDGFAVLGQEPSPMEVNVQRIDLNSAMVEVSETEVVEEEGSLERHHVALNETEENDLARVWLKE